MSKNVYSPFTNTSVNLQIPCLYDTSTGRHAAVAGATKSPAIFTAVGELFKGQNLVQLICSDVEWSFANLPSKNPKKSPSPTKSTRNANLLKFEERYLTKKKSTNNKLSSPSNMLSSTLSSSSSNSSSSTLSSQLLTSPSGVNDKRGLSLDDVNTDLQNKKLCTNVAVTIPSDERSKTLMAAFNQVNDNNYKGKNPENPVSCYSDEGEVESNDEE